MDVARTAIRSGSRDVSIVYYRGEENMTATQTELEYTRIDGVKFTTYRSTVEMTDDGLIYEDVSPGAEPNTLELMPADGIIIAVSHGPQANVVSTEPDILLDQGGQVITEEDGKTTMEGVYASGDVVTGPRTVVEAARAAKLTSNAIHNYIQGKKNPDWVEQDLWPDDCLDTDFEAYYPESNLGDLITEKMLSQ